MKILISIFSGLSLAVSAQIVHAALRDNGDGTISDLRSGLVWQQCASGSSGAGCSSGAAATYSWNNALAYCNALVLGGQTDWRLPNVKELHSIVDPARYSGATINTTYFPATPAADFWTSTTLQGTPSMAWYVQFSVGIAMTSPALKDSYLFNVRCVRGG